VSESPDLTVGLLAARFDDEFPDHAPEWVADKAVRTLRASERTALLAALLADRIEWRRRGRAREIEHRATLAAEREAAIASWPERQAANEAEREARRAEWAASPWFAPRNSREYRRWVTETPEGQRHEEQRKADAESRAERERLAEEDPLEYDRRYGWGRIAAFMEDFRQNVRLELTVELLGSSFSLGDGRATTWGAASIEDHHQRMALLMKGLEGSARTFALHEKAIEILAERHAACLNDVRFAA